jgi:enoyl-CoA hydratase/carnithine racemase
MSTTHGAVADTDSEVLVSRDDAIATITLNRPDALNSITPTMLVTLGDELDRLAADAAVRVVVLTGAGRAFSAGVDLKALGDRELVDGTVGDILDVPARRITELLSTMPAITVAKVNGFCFTGALELALACDIVVAAEEAKFGDTHTKFGLRPTWGMSQRLPRLVGISAARELSYTARTFSGVEAHRMGMVARVAPLAGLDAAVDELVAMLLANSPGSLRAYKDLYRETMERPLSAGLTYEAATTYPIPDTATRLADFR